MIAYFIEWNERGYFLLRSQSSINNLKITNETPISIYISSCCWLKYSSMMHNTNPKEKYNNSGNTNPISGLMFGVARSRREAQPIGMCHLNSILTSFFFLYDSLTTETIANRNIAKATAAHSRLVNQVYASVKAQSNQLRQEADFLRRKAKEEARIGITTGIPGCGPKCQQYEQEALAKEAERDSLSSQLKELDQLYNYDLSNLSPRNIFEQDKLALSQTPQDFLPDKYSNLDLPRKDYIDEESEVRILAPYYKLKSEDEKVREFALTSLAAALLVDGMAILLGTVVTRRRGQKSTLRVLQERLADLIRDFWRGFEYLIRAIEQIGRPTLRKYVDNENNLDRRRILEELTNLESRVRPHLELMKRNSSKNSSDSGIFTITLTRCLLI